MAIYHAKFYQKILKIDGASRRYELSNFWYSIVDYLSLPNSSSQHFTSQ